MTNRSKKLQRLFQRTSITQSRVSDFNKNTNSNQLSLTSNCFSSSLAPPRHWSSDSSYQCAHGSGLVKGSNHPGGSSPHQHDRFPSTHIPTKTQTHMRLFARLLITTRGLHLVAPQQNRATDEIFLPCCVVLLSLLTSEELLGNFGKL